MHVGSQESGWLQRAIYLHQYFKKTRYITHYNSLYNVTTINRYVTGQKNTIFDNYGYFIRNLCYVMLLT